MRFFRACTIGLLFLCVPALAHADTPDAYYARHRARRAGDVLRFVTATDFVWEQIITKEEKRTRGLRKVSEGQKHLVCSLLLIAPDEIPRTDVARSIAERSGMTTRSVLHAECAPRILQKGPVVAPILHTITVDKKNIPVSKNPVWNACVRNEGLSFDFIQSNTDRFEHRRGKVRLTRPWSCRDYHRGNIAFWTMPEEPDALLVLDKRGKFLGARMSSPRPMIVVPVKH